MNYSTAGEQGRTQSYQRYVTGIDGLRAIAVLCVLVYHIDERLLPGGFTGVDLFFVISGFVVSMATSGIRVSGLKLLVFAFYRRRMVRILPAALLFIVGGQFAAALFVPINDRLTVPDMTAAAATAGLSNIVLWSKAGDYFSPGLDLNLFTHTWSLAVEEQFYVLFPFFALLIWIWDDRPGARKWGTIGVVLFTFASMAVAALMTERDSTFAFFMLPTRFWELAAGVLLYVAIQHRSGRDTKAAPRPAVVIALSIMGTLLLVATFALITPNHFPFPSAIVPVLAGVVLIYVVTIEPGSLLSRLLSLPPVRYVGRISYSLYLWHWGVIVLMLWTTGLETPFQKIVAALVSLGLADISYRLVERPVRRSSWLAVRPDWQVAAMGLTAIGFAGVAVTGLTLLRPDISQSVTSDLATWLPNTLGEGGPCGVERVRDDFAAGAIRYEFNTKACTNVDARHLFVVGDSHAWAYQRLIGNVARTMGLSATIYWDTICPVLPDTADNDSGCQAFITEALAAVNKEAKRGDILFLPGLRTQRYREYWETTLEVRHSPEPYSNAQLDAAAERLSVFLDRGVRVIIEAPKPVYPYAPMRCSDWFNANNPHCHVAIPTVAEERARRADALHLIAAVRAREPRLEVWDAFPLLCPTSTCPAVLHGEPIVSDGDHLTGWANDFLTPFFRAAIESHSSPVVN